MLLSITEKEIFRMKNNMWNYAYTVPENKKVRVIVHTDCKNEADDQYAVAHHLMTPRFDVKGLVAGHFWKNPQQYGEAWYLHRQAMMRSSKLWILWALRTSIR